MRTLILALCAGLVFAPAAASGFDALKEIRPHSEAELSALKASAAKGDAKAELEYGKALVYLHGDPKNHVSEADYRAWFQKAADQNLAEAWYWLGYTTTDGALRDRATLKAAELGFAPAYDGVFDFLLFRAAEKADPAKAKYFFDLAQKYGVKYYESIPGEIGRTINACYEAGAADVPAAERSAIEKDGRVAQRYTPNDNMKFAEAYANGWGVKRNSKLALALVCHGAEVPAELIDMVDFLSKTQRDPALKKPFVFCEHLTSGMNGSWCETFDQDKTQAVRDRKLAKIVAGFTPEQKSAFAALKKANEAYIDAHSGDEQDMSGTLRGAFYAEEAGKLRAAFLNFIEGFESGKRPRKDDFAAADKALNQTYRAVIGTTDWTATGTVTADGVRKTERLWLKLRDAWAAFGTARYPGSSADDWKAWATRQRVESLKAGFRPFE
jgi:uncharacterized protein YecT (DUF1311 family)